VNAQGTLSEHWVHIQCTFSAHSVNIQWTFSENSVNIQWTFMEHLVNIQGTFRGHPSAHSGSMRRLRECQCAFREPSLTLCSSRCEWCLRRFPGPPLGSRCNGQT
jgi:hypothetical protein